MRFAPAADLTGESGLGLVLILDEHIDGGLEIGDEGCCPARGPLTRTAKAPAGVCGHHLGVFDGGLGDGGQLAGQSEHLVFGIAAAPAQPGGDLMGTTAHRPGAVPEAGPPGQPEDVQRGHGLRQLGHSFGQEPRVGRVGDVGRDDRGVGADLVELHHVGGHGLVEQRLVQLVGGLVPAAGGDLHERGGVGHGIGDPDATEAPPGDGISDLGTQRLEAEPTPAAEDHQPQLGLHRGSRPTDLRIEERCERLEEHRIVEQTINLLEPRWKAAELGREECLPQGLLIVYLGPQHDGSVLSGKRDGAIVASLGPEREHPRNMSALVRAFFHIYFFRAK